MLMYGVTRAAAWVGTTAALLASATSASERLTLAVAASLDLKGAVAALNTVLLSVAPSAFVFSEAATVMVLASTGEVLVEEPYAVVAGFVAGVKGVAVAVNVTVATGIAIVLATAWAADVACVEHGIVS